MSPRPYLRRARELSPALRAAIGFGVAAAAVWATVVVLDQVFDVDAGFLGPVLGLLMVAVVISAGVELVRHRSRWVRGIGGLMITGAAIAVLIVLLIIWYAAALCGSGGCS